VIEWHARESAHASFRLCNCIRAAAACGQSNVATLTGIVTDQSGSAAPNAEVTITSQDTGIVVRSHSNTEGVYSFPSLLAGAYRVEFQVAGFKKKQVPVLRLETAQKMRLDVSLEVGDVQQVIDVQAATTPLQQETAEISETITAKDIESIPLNGQIPYALLALTPGVSAAGDDPSSLA